jgi:ketosteroid isomerase-like protein
MARRLFTLLLCVATLSLSSWARPKKAEAMSAGAPDKALMQKIWDGWSTLDPANVAAYYASGPHTFFDIAPVKYDSWEEYQQGVKKVLAGYKHASCIVNDDAVVHTHGDLAWGTATVKTDLTENSGKRDMATMRWTVIWEKEGGKWLIVHEHVSEPIQ